MPDMPDMHCAGQTDRPVVEKDFYFYFSWRLETRPLFHGRLGSLVFVARRAVGGLEGTCACWVGDTRSFYFFGRVFLMVVVMVVKVPRLGYV